ncbi:MAG: spermidine synthase [Pseudomonadota bacterium]
MSLLFKELDYRETPMGVLSLRRRRELSLDIDVYEIKLDDEYLMSSLFTSAEIELTRLGLAALSSPDLDVVVGGLGLGYTAQTVLENPDVASLLVIDNLPEVIEWHQNGLLPLGKGLTSDARCRLQQGDFFARALAPTHGMNPDHPGRKHHAILLDVDHSPTNVLHPTHAAFYSRDGLEKLAGHLLPGGVFALWSNDLPDAGFQKTLDAVFATSEAHIVRFSHPVLDREDTNTVYVARLKDQG